MNTAFGTHVVRQQAGGHRQKRELREGLTAAPLPAPAPTAAPAAAPAGTADTLEALADVERRHILAVLDAVGGNKQDAARVLGIDRRTLYRKLDQYRQTEEEECSSG